MSRASGLRLVGLQAISIAVMMQGLTPDVHSLVSPLVMQWLFLDMAAGGPGADHHRPPEDDRPAPSNDAENDAAPDDVVVPGDPCAVATLSRRMANPPGRPATSKVPVRHADLSDPLRSEALRGPTEPITDLISFLGRLTC